MQLYDIKCFVEAPTSRNIVKCMDLGFAKLSLPPTLLQYCNTNNKRYQSFFPVGFYDENQETVNIMLPG